MPIILTDEEYIQARDSKEGFEAILTKTCALAVEDALRILPNVMQSLILQINDLKTTSDKFYRDNPKLEPHREKVAEIIEQVQAKSPGKTYTDILVEAKLEAERTLNLMEGKPLLADKKPSLDEIDYTLNMFEDSK